MATEQLSEYLERYITLEMLVDIKQKVQDKYRWVDGGWRRKNGVLGDFGRLRKFFGSSSGFWGFYGGFTCF